MTLRARQRSERLGANPLTPRETAGKWMTGMTSREHRLTHALDLETRHEFEQEVVDLPLQGLSIFTLGGLRVTRHYTSGEHFEVPTAAWRHGRALALAQYLLSRPGFEASREAIRDALWPDGDSRAVNAYLSNAIWNARKALGVPRDDKSVLYVTDTVIRLNVSRGALTPGVGVWLDTLAFDAEIKCLKAASDPHERLMVAQRALALYGGDFLPNCSEPHWSLPARERYRGLWATALMCSAQAHIDLQADDEALLPLHTLLMTMPDHEDGAALALTLLMEQKRQREARALYDHIRGFYRDWYRQEPPRALKQIVGPVLSTAARTTIPLPRKG